NLKNIKKEYINRIMQAMLEKAVLSKSDHIWLVCKTKFNIPSSNIISATEVVIKESEMIE
ncbi:MAG: hypothetical protein KH135_02015, partial [Firmicutes bacterium]|nr:hypothetical protein [Bacillota bacterium]